MIHPWPSERQTITWSLMPLAVHLCGWITNEEKQLWEGQTAVVCLMLWKLMRVGEVGMDMALATLTRSAWLSCHRCQRFLAAERTYEEETCISLWYFNFAIFLHWLWRKIFWITCWKHWTRMVFVIGQHIVSTDIFLSKKYWGIFQVCLRPPGCSAMLLGKLRSKFNLLAKMLDTFFRGKTGTAH